MATPAPLRNNYLALCEYVASATFLATTAWKREGIADFLVNKNDGGRKTCIIVGEVLDDRLFCGPNGNHTGKGEYAKDFEAARFSLFLGKPESSDYGPDFDTAQQKMDNIEEKVALTTDRRYFREASGLNKVFKLAAPLFEERDTPLDKNETSLWSKEDKAQVDEVNTWPSSGDAKNHLRRLSLTHRVLALPVFDINHSIVAPARVNSVLRNSIVEVHFNIKHHAIRVEGVAKFDTYTAFIRQIVVIKKAPPKAPDPYRRTLRNGPVVFTPKIVSSALPSPPADEHVSATGEEPLNKAVNVGEEVNRVENDGDGPPPLVTLNHDSQLVVHPVTHTSLAALVEPTLHTTSDGRTLGEGEMRGDGLAGGQAIAEGKEGDPVEKEDYPGENGEGPLAGKDHQGVKRRGASVERAAKRSRKAAGSVGT